jgi:hypothetical protein
VTEVQQREIQQLRGALTKEEKQQARDQELSNLKNPIHYPVANNNPNSYPVARNGIPIFEPPQNYRS